MSSDPLRSNVKLVWGMIRKLEPLDAWSSTYNDFLEQRVLVSIMCFLGILGSFPAVYREIAFQ